MAISANNFTNYSFYDFSSEAVPPVALSTYLWTACKRGKLFDFDTYDYHSLINWTKIFLRKTMEDIIVPKNFEKTKILRKLEQKVLDNFSGSNIVEKFESTDPHDVSSLKEFMQENKEIGDESFDKFLTFLKQETFPPILWMEFERFAKVFVDTSLMMLDSMEKWFKLGPRRQGLVRERSKLVKWMFQPYRNLAYQYLGAFIALFKMFLFIEIWSSETEDAIFSGKPWTLENVSYENIESILIEFHNSIGGLRQELLRFRPEKREITFSKPTDWAFKRLVQMVEV